MEPAARAKPHPHWYQLLQRRRTDEESFQSGPTTLVWVPPYVFLPQALPGGRDASPCYFSITICCSRRQRGGRNGPHPCVLFRSACCNRKKMGVPRWPPLCLCTPFPALHSSARNHATRFSMFFKKVEEHSVVLQCHGSGSLFCTAGRRNQTHDLCSLSCSKCRSKHWHTLRNRKWVFIFLVYCTCKVKKGKILKTLRQNNAVVRRAALLERKQRQS